MKQTFLFFILAAFLFSCKKDDATTSTPASLIIGKWTFNKYIDWSTHLGVTTKDTIISHPGEYADFRADGKFYSYTWESTSSTTGRFYYDTANYVINDTQLILSYNNSTSTDTATIQALTSNNLNLYTKNVGGGYTDETWSFLSK